MRPRAGHSTPCLHVHLPVRLTARLAPRSRHAGAHVSSPRGMPLRMIERHGHAPPINLLPRWHHSSAMISPLSTRSDEHPPGWCQSADTMDSSSPLDSEEHVSVSASIPCGSWAQQPLCSPGYLQLSWTWRPCPPILYTHTHNHTLCMQVSQIPTPTPVRSPPSTTCQENNPMTPAADIQTVVTTYSLVCFHAKM